MLQTTVSAAAVKCRPGNMTIVRAGEQSNTALQERVRFAESQPCILLALNKPFFKKTPLPYPQVKEYQYKFALEYPWNESEEMTFRDSVFDQHKTAWGTGACNRSRMGNYIHLLGWFSLELYDFGNEQLLRNSRKAPSRKTFRVVRKWLENNKNMFALIISEERWSEIWNIDRCVAEKFSKQREKVFCYVCMQGHVTLKKNHEAYNEPSWDYIWDYFYFSSYSTSVFGFPCLKLFYDSKWKFIFLSGWLHKQKIKLSSSLANKPQRNSSKPYGFLCTKRLRQTPLQTE